MEKACVLKKRAAQGHLSMSAESIFYFRINKILQQGSHLQKLPALHLHGLYGAILALIGVREGLIARQLQFHSQYFF